ncbi:uncharacterized protein METZ01_LOCUS51475 [marine metagenome]|uniref:Uncharacterized protein n=1 Tax=marine metagenome TaxID=408172 RepID=A0A381S5L9_9ZZZZ
MILPAKTTVEELPAGDPHSANIN